MRIPSLLTVAKIVIARYWKKSKTPEVSDGVRTYRCMMMKNQLKPVFKYRQGEYWKYSKMFIVRWGGGII